jgi:hypothetical protein
VNQSQGWVGVDLDGTLAEYHGWVAADQIGPPILAMTERVKEWLGSGRDVRIFTARGSLNDQDEAIAFPAIERWCEEHLGMILPITNVKDIHMIELYDDRAHRVVRNKGVALDEEMLGLIAIELTKARRKFPSARGSMCALTEEVGELAKACMDEPLENVIAEAVQVACMAIRVATEGDGTLNEIREKRGQELFDAEIKED